eukprot:4218559-Pyramimonas_sp.AAC.1
MYDDTDGADVEYAVDAYDDVHAADDVAYDGTDGDEDDADDCDDDDDDAADDDDCDDTVDDT